MNSGIDLLFVESGAVGRQALAISSAEIGSAWARGGQMITIAPSITVEAKGSSSIWNAEARYASA